MQNLYFIHDYAWLWPKTYNTLIEMIHYMLYIFYIRKLDEYLVCLLCVYVIMLYGMRCALYRRRENYWWVIECNEHWKPCHVLKFYRNKWNHSKYNNVPFSISYVITKPGQHSVKIFNAQNQHRILTFKLFLIWHDVLEKIFQLSITIFKLPFDC